MQNKKSHSLELISRPEATTASQENDAAKIQKNVIGAITNLKIIAESIAAFLESGVYCDTTGVAKVNISPVIDRRP